MWPRKELSLTKMKRFTLFQSGVLSKRRLKYMKAKDFNENIDNRENIIDDLYSSNARGA
jgi:hypothetical protein